MIANEIDEFSSISVIPFHRRAPFPLISKAKGDREDALRISSHVADLETRAPQLKTLARARILMHLGDRAGAVELMRPIFRGRQPRFLQALMELHRGGQVPQSMADYAPFQELVGWPPPLPN